MSQHAYEVTVAPHHFPDNLLGYEAIEIIPPVSKQLAELACTIVMDYCNNLPSQDTAAQDGAAQTIVEAFGFFDEGASVNTLLKFRTTPTFSSENGRIPRELEKLGSIVEKLISPSGRAIKSK